jgi:hypothetical protein
MGAGASQPKAASAPSKSVEPIKVNAGGATRQNQPVRPYRLYRPDAVVHALCTDGGYMASAILHGLAASGFGRR